MKTMIALFGLVLIIFLNPGYAQPFSSPKTFAEESGQSWLTNYYGKTLSSLGDIVSVHIDVSGRSSSTNHQHSAVWQIIEHSKIQDFHSASVAGGIRPKFGIEFADGMHARCDYYTAFFTWPDGRTGSVILIPSPNQTPEPTPVGAGSSASRTTP